MIVKLKKVEDATRKEFPFKVIKGEKADGSDYEKWIIVGNKYKEVLDSLAQCGIGDFIKLTYDNTQYKNVESITIVDGFPDEPQKKKFSGGGSNNVRRTDGTSRGDDTNRSAAIYLAKDIVKMKLESMAAADKKKLATTDMAVMCIDAAGPIFQYIKGGVSTTGPTKTIDEIDTPEV